MEPHNDLHSRALQWLRQQPPNSELQQTQMLSLVFPDGPYPNEDSKLDIIVAAVSREALDERLHKLSLGPSLMATDFGKLYSFAWGKTEHPLFRKLNMKSTSSIVWALDLDDKVFTFIRNKFEITHGLIREEFLAAMSAVGHWFSKNDATYVPDSGDVDDDAMDVDKPLGPFSLDRFTHSDGLESAMSDFLSLKAGPAQSSQSFALLGHPGIGKSFLLYIVLLLRLRQKLPTVFLENEREAFIFSEDRVSLIDLTDVILRQDIKKHLSSTAWILVDVNATKFVGPTSDTLELRRPTIVATSYRPDHLAWESKYPRTRRYFLDVWIEEEIIQGLELSKIEPKHALAEIRLLYNAFPPVPRVLYSSTYASLMDRCRDIINNINMNFDREKLTRLLTMGDDKSPLLDLSRLITVVRANKTDRRKAIISFGSNHVLGLLLMAQGGAMERIAIQTYETFLSVNSLHGPAGQILENRLARTLMARKEAWTLVALDQYRAAKYCHWRVDPEGQKSYFTFYPKNGDPFFLTDNSSQKRRPHANPEKISFYEYPSTMTLANKPTGFYQPMLSNQATFDAFFYIQESKLAIIFQCTVGKVHSAKAAGFNWLKEGGVKEIWFVAVHGGQQLDFPVTETAQESTQADRRFALKVDVGDLYNGVGFNLNPQVPATP